MAVYEPRRRMISFRLSEDEYEFFRKDSLSQGARSLSDYARSALRRLILGESGASGNGVEAKIQQLDGSMQELSQQVRRLLLLLEQRQEDPQPPTSV